VLGFDSQCSRRIDPDQRIDRHPIGSAELPKLIVYTGVVKPLQFSEATGDRRAALAIVVCAIRAVTAITHDAAFGEEGTTTR